jgi:hypothetical protein
MDQFGDQSAVRVLRTIEQEMSLVREAMRLVVSGGSPRVVVGGLRFGEELLAPAQAMAAEAGVRLVPLWMPDDAGLDVAVERIADG